LKKLAVLVIHGVGSQQPDYASAMIDELSSRLSDKGNDPTSIVWQPVYWADILEPRETAYLERAGDTNALDWFTLRRLVVQALGDAAAYKYVDSPSATYTAIHNRIRSEMSRLFDHKLKGEPVPLVILAHSLGSQIMSCYIWDTQHDMPSGADSTATAFEKMEWLAGFVTFGSPIPLFTFADDAPMPIRFPGSEIGPGIGARAKWLNFYDRDDVLGYPIKPVNNAYDAVVSEDVEVNVGGLVSASTPQSHTHYWTDNSFTRPVVDFLDSLID